MTKNLSEAYSVQITKLQKSVDASKRTGEVTNVDYARILMHIAQLQDVIQKALKKNPSAQITVEDYEDLVKEALSSENDVSEEDKSDIAERSQRIREAMSHFD